MAEFLKPAKLTFRYFPRSVWFPSSFGKIVAIHTGVSLLFLPCRVTVQPAMGGSFGLSFANLHLVNACDRGGNTAAVHVTFFCCQPADKQRYSLTLSSLSAAPAYSSQHLSLLYVRWVVETDFLAIYSPASDRCSVHSRFLLTVSQPVIDSTNHSHTSRVVHVHVTLTISLRSLSCKQDFQQATSPTSLCPS